MFIQIQRVYKSSLLQHKVVHFPALPRNTFLNIHILLMKLKFIFTLVDVLGLSETTTCIT